MARDLLFGEQPSFPRRFAPGSAPSRWARARGSPSGRVSPAAPHPPPPTQRPPHGPATVNHAGSLLRAASVTVPAPARRRDVDR